MPPITEEERELEKNKAQVVKWIKDDSTPVIVFSKTTCPFCKKVKELLNTLTVKYTAIELDTLPNGPALQSALHSLTNQKTVPNVFIRGQHIGGCDATTKLHEDGKLLPLINAGGGSAATLPASASNTSTNGEVAQRKYDYDLVVIGGGSGGLAAAKEAAGLGAKVAVFDFVQPTPMGTAWGLGGTCVNVGCIPKKLMHQASLLGEGIEDAKKYGWEIGEEKKHNWQTMITNVQDYISSLNWKYKLALRDATVTYHNAYAKFVDPHKMLAVTAKNKQVELTSERFIIATGGRPRYPDIPGAKEYCITSDDIFSLPYPPGRTLVVGASYVALECAGFLHGLGYDVTVMVRSIFLRGFDQEMAERIGKYMEETKGIKFIKQAVPTKVERLEEGEPGRLRVTSDQKGQEIVDEYNTVLFAIGRDACTGTIGLEKAGVKVNPKTGKLDAIAEQTNVKHVYAIGDVLCGRPELTPVAIQAGTMLARRLYGGSSEVYDYDMIPTTVFTPLEYGAIGYAEEAAIEKYGKENIEVYHTLYRPLEWTLPGHADNACYAKLVCLKSEDERVIGFHVCGPNAGEITQGYAVGMRLGARKKDFDLTTGIHPTCSEIFTTLNITKSSGKDISAAAC
ncbi:thioredoxin reductase 1, cytoplasmic-like isoform X2 [Paramacrobiotus metropolitanus]|nr:thioredoxin reductase 1, cytoplasmic-like isoform X2 [Paramacrobiotus metropolitanus]